jgi:hypothetical protein
MAKEGNATLTERFRRYFDQIMVLQQLVFPETKSFKYWKSGIYNKPLPYSNYWSI